MPKNEEPEYTDDDHGHIQRMADRLGLKDKERARYVDDHMTGLGYKRSVTYVPGDDDDDDEGGGRFRVGKRGQQSGGQRRRSRDDDDWYGS